MRALWLLLFPMFLSLSQSLRPPAIPFPFREDELEFLTSEEEERLIFGKDMSVIHKKIKDIPDQREEPPNSDEPLPLPTMDPPLPKNPPKIRKPKKHRGFPFKIPRTLSMLSMMAAPLKRKPRMRSVQPVPSYRARPSTLISSEPDQLEIAFKRIEIMASRAGLNMSSMPRTTQLEVVKRLVPKLPPRMSHLVKTALDTKSDKMFHYLPEPLPEPVIHSSPDFSSYHIHEDAHDEFDSPTGSKVGPGPTFDAAKISITSSGETQPHDDFEHLPSITMKYESIDSVMSPPAVSGHNDYGSTYRDLPFDAVASPLISDGFTDESRDSPVVLTAMGRSNKAMKVVSVKQSVTPVPIRVAQPTKDKITTTRRPIRVSIISKDTISTNRTLDSGESIVKVIEIEAVPDDEDEPVLAQVQEVRQESSSSSPSIRPISVDIIQEEEAKFKKERKPVPTTTSQRPVTTTTELPDLHKLDLYDDWTEDGGTGEDWGSAGVDPYDLTDEEIASTVAELKKYEEKGIFDNSLEQEFPWRLAPHPLEYPDHPDHPKDSVEIETKTEAPVENLKSSSVPPPVKRPQVGFGPGPMRRPPFGGPPRRPPMRRPFPKRPPPQHLRPRRPPPRPFRINEVTVSEIPKEYNKECDYFSEDLCLVVQDYPIEAISEAMEKHPASSSLLVKEPEVSSWVDGMTKGQENSYNFNHYFGLRRSDDETTHRHRDFAGEGGFLCPSKVAYGQVKKARSSSTGDWKWVVNYAETTQTLRLEKCLSPGNTCSYVMPHYRTACTQVYNYHRLLAWDPEKGLHVDVFKVPTCCTCHVQGYYIPQQQGFTPVRRRHDGPPRFKFAPPRGFGRGGGVGIKPMPPVKQLKPWPVPSPLATTASPKDDLQDLLSQYSALREKIAKKKNENLQVWYSVSISNGTESLTTKIRESRTSQYPAKLKRLQKLKLLSANLKKLNRTGKPFKNIKSPLARVLLLKRLNKKLQRVSATSRSLRAKSLKLGETEPLSKTRLQSRIQLLRSRLDKYNERKKRKQTVSPDRLRSKSRQQVSRQRLESARPKETPENKVNYSYHPIMDYFNRSAGKQAKKVA